MPTWPAGLPQDFFVGLSQQRRSAVEQFTNDAGPSSRRRYVSGVGKDVEDTIVLTAAQKVIFDTFFQTTLLEGSLEFDWIDNESGNPASYRFNSPPRVQQLYTPTGFYYRVELSLEQMP